MTEGLLWYDADGKRQTGQKIDDAVNRYRDRFGRAPNCCHVNPNQLVEHANVQVVANPRVLHHHFWVGIDETLPQARGTRRRGAA